MRCSIRRTGPSGLAAVVDIPVSHSWDRSSLAVGRSRGSLRKHAFRKLRSSGDIPGGVGGCSSRTIANSAGIGWRSKYGGEPVSSSTTTHATDHTSLFGSNVPLISITSGAIQYGVPTTSPSSFGLLLASLVTAPSPPILAALPKSASLTHPSLVARRLAPLTSRCTTPLDGECR